MANIENYKIFRKLKEATRENVLYMIYRAERLYAAMSHAEKIFEMVSLIIFDREQTDKIVKNKSISKEDQVFAKHHEIIIRRLSTQINSF